jgi:hypothetical protein
MAWDIFLEFKAIKVTAAGAVACASRKSGLASVVVCHSPSVDHRGLLRLGVKPGLFITSLRFDLSRYGEVCWE